MSRFYRSILFICTLLGAASWAAFAQGGNEGRMAANSALNGIRLPPGAVRIDQQNIPNEIRTTLASLIRQGGGNVRQGEVEVLVWNGGAQNSNQVEFPKRFTKSLRAEGWSYGVGVENADFTVFNSLNTTDQRSFMGFWMAKDDFVLLAWAEMLPANAAAEPPRSSGHRSDNIDIPVKNANSVQVVTAEKNALWVNVMGSEMPSMPKFPPLTPKPGRVRGYVKDWTGKPLAGAAIGVRGSFFAGQYSGAQGTSDANGYYEFVVPKGTAHFYNAGYQIKWGEGLAAVSLHPADGTLENFTTVDGAVEHFVQLPYGITSREALQNNPRVSSSYYGGSVYVHYYAAEADDNRPMAGSIVEGTTLEIILTPEDPGGTSFVIRQPVGFAGNVTINNIPLGRYKISAKAAGKTLKLQENRKFNPLFGLTPGETVGAAKMLFVPSNAKASMIGPANGAWESVSLSVLMP